ncbi:O-methyltransferase [Microbacterium marinilacus]|uniref:O-methyltransferase n=1 Tax=Microbacterium marinilacus TaxID=415209 RepID=A0ABP7B8I0_9MICO|nr:O-methyltransferase [Microbacterium marinilacus]MBY0687406.1 O-methyltransferase [Microbacterium marinilacus]
MAESTPENWAAADRWLAAALLPHDPELDAAVTAQREAALPEIEVAPVAGKLLHLLARLVGAQRILEIGTLGGYSTIWLARALPAGGTLVTIEAEPAHAGVARGSIDRAGVGDRVDVRVGPALDVLPTLAGPFDLVFIDADKESNTAYLDWAARLGRPGGLVVLDNIGRDGEIVRDDSSDPKVRGTREAIEMLGSDPRFDATALQTVGVKGWDGVAIAILTGEAGTGAVAGDATP